MRERWAARFRMGRLVGRESSARAMAWLLVQSSKGPRAGLAAMVGSRVSQEMGVWVRRWVRRVVGGGIVRVEAWVVVAVVVVVVVAIVVGGFDGCCCRDLKYVLVRDSRERRVNGVCNVLCK